MRKKIKFVVSRRVDGQFQFNIVAGNGEIIAVSEGYHNKKDALDTIKVIMEMSDSAILEDNSDSVITG